MTPALKSEHPRGMVLIFVLCILAILAVLCTSIFLSTRDELQVSADNSVSRDAFTKADLTARLAVFLSRTSLYGSPGETSDSLKSGAISGRPEFEIELADNFSTSVFQQAGDQMTDSLIRQRYIWAASGHPQSTRPEKDPEHPNSTKDVKAIPHVAIYAKYGGEEGGGSQRQLVGTAVVAYGTSKKTSGGSQGEGSYKTGSGGAYARVFLIITADGRVPAGPKDKSGQANLPVDPSNYFLGDDFARHSIVTTIYQEILQ